MKADDIYKIFTDGIKDLKERFESLEGRFESLESKIDDRFVTKESLKVQLNSLEQRLSNYEEMRQDIRKLGWGIATSIIGMLISLSLYLIQSGIFKNVKL